jgi:drug/metabolite transporter (DMT)-like permease
LLYLLGSVLLSSYLTLSFKWIQKLKISSFQTIVFNYLTCAVTGSLLSGSFPFISSFHQPWINWALLVGLTFITLLNIIAITAQEISVAVASVANKLSLVIPFIFSIFLYNEEATTLKIAGVAIALAGVILSSLPGKNEKKAYKAEIPVRKFLLPLILFIGSGLLDTMMKYVQIKYLQNNDETDYMTTLFTTAAVVGLVSLPVFLKIKKQSFDPSSILAGICIGIPNYFSIWCLIKVLKAFNNNSSAIIPINNMGIVLVSSLAAWIIFREKLSLVNWIGIVLSMGAIALIAFG